MKEPPLISVLMGVYYRSQDTSLLERSIRSILYQSLEHLELLICDDGSHPKASALLEQYAAEDERVRLIRTGSAYALPCKLNLCLRSARGSWIARMDDDDYSHPQRLEKQLDYLRENQDVAFVGCNVNLSCDGRLVGTRHFPERPAVRDFYFVQPFIHPALLFRKEALDAVNGYCEDKRCILCEDYDLLLRLYGAGYQGANLQECLLDYTIPKSAKGKRNMSHRWNEAVTRYRRFGELGLLPQALPYVMKPLIVGMIPEALLQKLKNRRDNGGF